VAKPLAVFDCVVFVQSLISEAGPAARSLELFEQGKFSIAVSRDILSEIREVLSRSTLRQNYPRLTDERVQQLIEVLLYRGKFFRRIGRQYEYARDPFDEAYLNLAIEARANFLVTRDNDMLDLMKWEREEGREFQKRFRELKVVDPVAFLKAIEGKSA
jgi:putative PIN family toxin of toxin-antitoxin system